MRCPLFLENLYGLMSLKVTLQRDGSKGRGVQRGLQVKHSYRSNKGDRIQDEGIRPWELNSGFPRCLEPEQSPWGGWGL